MKNKLSKNNFSLNKVINEKEGKQKNILGKEKEFLDVQDSYFGFDKHFMNNFTRENTPDKLKKQLKSCASINGDLESEDENCSRFTGNENTTRSLCSLDIKKLKTNAYRENPYLSSIKHPEDNSGLNPYSNFHHAPSYDLLDGCKP